MSISSLREELNKTKQKEELITEDGAMEWLKENVIPLNEGIDPKVLKHLIDLVQRFDSKLRTYGDRLPTISSIIDNAENELNQVISGNAKYRSKKRTGELLQNLTSVYNHMSDLFRNKLKIVLSAPLFKRAREEGNSSIPLKAVEGIDFEMMVNCFRQALKPTTVQQRLWGKIINKNSYDAIVKELTDMSYSDLMDLVNGIPKVPVVVPVREPEPVQQQQQEMAPQAPVAETPMASITAPSPAEEQVMSESQSFLEEQLDQKTQQMVNQSSAIIANLLRSLKGKGLQASEAAMGNLLKQMRRAIDANDKKSLGTLLGQAQHTIGIFQGIKTAIPEIQKLFTDNELDQEDFNFIAKRLLAVAQQSEQKATTGGFFKAISNFFGNVGKTNPFPGLSAQNIVEDIMEEVEKMVTAPQDGSGEQQQPQAGQQPVQEAVLYEAIKASDFFNGLSKALTTGLTQQKQTPMPKTQPTGQQNPSDKPGVTGNKNPSDPSATATGQLPGGVQAPQTAGGRPNIQTAIGSLAQALGKDPGQLTSVLMNNGLLGNVNK